jgi:hypothetical protein
LKVRASYENAAATGRSDDLSAKLHPTLPYKPIGIDQFCARIGAAGVQGVESYRQRLRDNQNNQRLQDLAYEGWVALAFSNRGWTITIRDRPDLEGRLNGIYLGIEVKHFRYKHAHDPIEDAVLRSGGGTLPRIPPLSETEGREDSWDQMARFAIENSHQYVDGEFNVIFFWCSTQAHFDGTLITAANIYDEKLIQNPSCDPRMQNLSAMMMHRVWATVGYDSRSILWKPIRHAKRPITTELGSLLEEIRTAEGRGYVLIP